SPFSPNRLQHRPATLAVLSKTARLAILPVARPVPEIWAARRIRITRVDPLARRLTVLPHAWHLRLHQPLWLSTLRPSISYLFSLSTLDSPLSTLLRLSSLGSLLSAILRLHELFASHYAAARGIPGSLPRSPQGGSRSCLHFPGPRPRPNELGQHDRRPRL